MPRIHTDLSIVAISAAPSPATSGTSLGVTDANAAYLPDTYPYWAVLVPTGTAPTRTNSEIVKVTAGSSSAGTTTLTIVRAQGTPVTTAQTVTTGFDIYDANSAEATTRLASKTITLTRDIAGANGDVSYTGIGFVPTSIIFSYMTTDGKCVGTGMVDSVKAMASYFSAQQAGYLVGVSASDKCIYFSNQSGTDHQALLKTYDADGFTLTWNKTGTPTGTGNIIAMCFR